MTDDLAERMRRARVEDLILMARDRPEDGISPDAVVAARSELAAREIPEESAQDVEANIEAQHQEKLAATSKPLPNPAWIVFVIIGPVLFVSLFGVFALYTRGYKQMARDAVGAIFIGYAVLLLALLALVGVSTLIG